MKFKIGDIIRMMRSPYSAGKWRVKDIKAGCIYIVPIDHNGYGYAKNNDGTYPFGVYAFEKVTKGKAHLPDWM